MDLDTDTDTPANKSWWSPKLDGNVVHNGEVCRVAKVPESPCWPPTVGQECLYGESPCRIIRGGTTMDPTAYVIQILDDTGSETTTGRNTHLRRLQPPHHQDAYTLLPPDGGIKYAEWRAVAAQNAAEAPRRGRSE